MFSSAIQHVAVFEVHTEPTSTFRSSLLQAWTTQSGSNYMFNPLNEINLV